MIAGPNSIKSLLNWRVLSSQRILQCPFMWVLEFVYSTSCKCCPISAQYTEKNFIFSTFLYRTHQQNCRWRYCPMAVATVEVVFRKDTTAPHAVYAKLYSERSLFQMQPREWCLMDLHIQHLTLPLHSAHYDCCSHVLVAWMRSFLSDCIIVHKSAGFPLSCIPTLFPEYIWSICIT
jgi:hypothetical protein